MKSDPSLQVDVIISWWCISGLSLGKWWECLQQFPLHFSGLLLACNRRPCWDSHYFWNKYVWPLLNLQCLSGEPHPSVLHQLWRIVLDNLLAGILALQWMLPMHLQVMAGWTNLLLGFASSHHHRATGCWAWSLGLQEYGQGANAATLWCARYLWPCGHYSVLLLRDCLSNKWTPLLLRGGGLVWFTMPKECQVWGEFIGPYHQRMLLTWLCQASSKMSGMSLWKALGVTGFYHSYLLACTLYCMAVDVFSARYTGLHRGYVCPVHHPWSLLSCHRYTHLPALWLLGCDSFALWSCSSQ